MKYTFETNLTDWGNVEMNRALGILLFGTGLVVIVGCMIATISTLNIGSCADSFAESRCQEGAFNARVVFFVIGAIGVGIMFSGAALIRRTSSGSSDANLPTSQVRSNFSSNLATPNIEQELQKAADMLKSGLIDDDEYKELKKKIISKS